MNMTTADKPKELQSSHQVLKRMSDPMRENPQSIQKANELILIVDDDPAMRLLMGEALQQAGLHVIEAENGFEAVELFRQHIPNLVLMDVKMPGLDGYDACRQIRQSEAGQETPIIMVTGLEDDESIKMAYQAGATDFITKPVIWSILSHRVRYLLRAGNAFKALSRNQQRLARAQRVARLGNWEWDIVQDIFHWSDELYRIMGRQPDDGVFSLQDCMSHIYPDDRSVIQHALDDAINHNIPFKIDHKIIRADGSELEVEQQAEIIYNDLGVAIRMYGTLQDVSERKSAERRIRQLAYYDLLTGLPNRQSFNDTMQREMNIARREGTRLALIFLDLDHFKEINDTLGHKAGDELLQHVAEYLNRSIRNTDIIAKLSPDEQAQPSLSRLGGDEFTILLPGLKEVETAAQVCERVLNHLKIPMLLEGQEVSVTGSLGIAIYPDDGEDLDTLLRHSDMAMYNAKQSGKNAYRFFTDEMNTSVQQRLKTESSLKQALNLDQFELYCEPRVCLQSGKIVGAEALIRWHHPQKGLLVAAQFLDVADETGLIIPIGEWVLEQACRQLQQWRAQGFEQLTMTVNLSAQQFRQKNLLEQVKECIRRYQFPPQFLNIELTESTLVDDMQRASEVFSALKSLGVQLSLDNFGTGYSSFTYLKKFPVDHLKIDRHFTALIHQNVKDAAIIKAIITLTQELNLTSIAAGISNAEQLSTLREMGCNQVQGPLISDPLPAEKIIQLLETDE
jgi:diguanylate cyclase (GGDEF)-like protein